MHPGKLRDTQGKEYLSSGYHSLPSASKFFTIVMQFGPDSHAFGQTCAYTRPVEPCL